jgi:hypothetical protein
LALINILVVVVIFALVSSDVETQGVLPGLDVLVGNEPVVQFDGDEPNFDLFRITDNVVPICVGNLEEYDNLIIGINLALTNTYQGAISAAATASQETPGTNEYNQAIARYNVALDNFETIHSDWVEIDHPSCMMIPLINDEPVTFYWEESFDSYVRSVQGYIGMIGAREQNNGPLVTEMFTMYVDSQSQAEWTNGFFFGQMLLLIELQEVPELTSVPGETQATPDDGEL